jgi:hypothetical protein
MVPEDAGSVDLVLPSAAGACFVHGVTVVSPVSSSDLPPEVPAPGISGHAATTREKRA